MKLRTLSLSLGLLACSGPEDSATPAEPAPYESGWQVPDEPLLAPDGLQVVLSDFPADRLLLDLTALWAMPVARLDEREAVLEAEPELRWVTVAVQDQEGGTVDASEVAELEAALPNEALGDPERWTLPDAQVVFPRFFLLDADRRVLGELDAAADADGLLAEIRGF